MLTRRQARIVELIAAGHSDRAIGRTLGISTRTVHAHLQNIYRALDYLRPEQIYVDPDCGLKTRTVEEAKAKLRVIQQARNEVRAELAAGKVPVRA